MNKRMGLASLLLIGLVAHGLGLAPSVRGAAPETYGAVILADGPVGYYRLDEASGPTIVDSSGGGADGTYAGTPVFGEDGALPEPNDAVRFEGSPDSGSVPRTISDDFSIETWVKTTQTTSSINAQWYTGAPLVGAEVCGGATDFGLNELGGRAGFGTGSSDSGDHTSVSSAPINDGAWHHVVATREKATGIKKVYVDGQLSATATHGTDSLTAPGSIGLATQPCGGNAIATLDEVAMYDTVLSASRVLAHYLAGTGGGPDADGDGVADEDDECENTPSGESVNGDGCSDSQLDDDLDGVSNLDDGCPATADGAPVDVDGCAVSDKQPDAEARVANGTLAGDNVYNATGTDQSAATTVKPKKSATFEVKITNDGTVSESFDVTTCPTPPRFAMTYADPADVSATVKGGTYNTGDLAPGASRSITVTVKAPKKGSMSCLVTVTSDDDSDAKDAVGIAVKVKKKKKK